MTPQISQINNTTQIIEQLKPIARTIKMVEAGPNQGAMLESLMANNPQVRDICNTLKAANGNYETVFYAMAKQRGCSDEQAKQILSELQQSWKSL